jgi:hypothetical protein
MGTFGGRVDETEALSVLKTHQISRMLVHA